MKRTITIALFIFAVAAASFGEADDKKAALAIVNQLFAEMSAANQPAIVDLHTTDSQLVAIRKLRDGKKRVDVIGRDAFSKFFTDKNAGLKEVMYDPKIEVSGDWAMVWGRYVFFVKDKISHCGINQFNLVRTDAGWKIANGASTIDPGDCTEKEKGMKP